MPRISVIIPVLHESGIDGFLDRLYARFEPSFFEVILVDGDPKGGSLSTVDRPHVITLVAKTGRGPQMNAGARVARGEILLFLHADTELPDPAFERISETMATERYAAGAFSLGFMENKKSFSLIARAAALRSRLTRIPYGDQAIFMKRSVFDRMGGYQEIPIMEDMDLMRRIRQRGGRVRILQEAVLTSPRRWKKEGVIFSLFRTWLLSLFFTCGVSPVRLLKYYKPHGS
ncbi:TIGR04283 family arsenosugar biosynthesis glycosyltransferase [Desulfoluna sp.]|uniref:TIGR04283 family arsenosugar biosynthesis glycosyltransferase n=1 Tax=Desulfoluna sp. TaxID=2045199 RepID=UPI00261F85CD|nr:TIGR04283 family arsenosugar biosynthesis glycosyltransferase [Desulfoluna sp.]